MFLAFGGNAARIFTTTLSEVQDKLILIQYISAASLTGLITLQILIYGNKGAKVEGAKDTKKE
eukprot:CAMPEP_0114577454 /NCGR_PEP_ID=MMETSP0125-20121206/2111_1 /TAXON_ID=485358 ORGANISM="Aristerostoma sp., Strain ATCC 50986" /NCGR_SAMPLE_ID=MMETSP0125 /ASSEMBLY_ACC=CAM_ASM_000245 /LENGTH=62 /DNA_ID=CAMNT_0001766775 /DNA_START=531 /DNA_END=719 /DNA_ORIENTATION=+